MIITTSTEFVRADHEFDSKIHNAEGIEMSCLTIIVWRVARKSRFKKFHFDF